MMSRRATVWTVLWIATWAGQVSAADWTGFRGPGARGVSEETGLAVSWSETENLAWKTPLPGPGSSSPIVLGERVFVTCYSGYGLDPNRPGDPNHLKRHLLCIRATDGEVLCDTAVPAARPEDSYHGMLREHGYASQTPVTDGQRVYVFFGKTGVLAFDLDGKQLWQTSVGTDSDQKRWGTAASPALYKNLLFVNAWDESKTLYALDTQTGREVWKKDVSKTGLSFCTPVVTTREDGGAELVVVVPSQVWGLDPETGWQLWLARTGINDDMIPTPVILDGVAYIHGGGPRQYGSLAVRTGGDGDVTDTHVVWSGKNVTSPPSPVVVDGRMYWADGYGRACCADAKTGELLYSEKLPITQRFAIYGSMVAAEGRLYVVTRNDGTFVLAAKPQYQIIAHNQFASDASDFNASPAVSNKCLFLRSNRFLYCVRQSH
ncbi:MAG: PQQ-binding-like beta-propeller repeat protein [Phycisphaerae bacterium]|nr:PQQ-binding-like beta-propeller repeat protein [Phycisphaerae bacterium]